MAAFPAVRNLRMSTPITPSTSFAHPALPARPGLHAMQAANDGATRNGWEQTIHDAALASEPEHLGQMDRQHQLLAWINDLNATLDRYNPDLGLADGTRQDMQALVDNLRDAPSSIPNWLLRDVDTTADRISGILDAATAPSDPVPPDTPAPPDTAGQVPGGGLEAHEEAGSHLIAKHVGKTAEELIARLKRENISASSSFLDLPHAEHFVASLIAQNQERIDAWVDGKGGNRLVLDGRFDATTGISVERGSDHAEDVHSVKLVLERSDKLGIGYRIVTGYPTKP